MDASYARDRLRKPHLVFRYQCRGLIAARMYQRFSGSRTAKRVLDLGSAEGRAMAEVHRLLGAESSVGIEFSPELIALAQLPAGCTLHQGDVTKAHEAAPAGSFDLVTALAVLEHVDDAPALARRVHDSLRPGGIFVATCPFPVWDQISGALRLHKDEHHTGAFNRSKFEAFARAGGLEPVRYQRFMFAPIGFLPYLGVKPSPSFALAVDSVLAPIPLVNLSMVNQVFVARRGA